MKTYTYTLGAFLEELDKKYYMVGESPSHHSNDTICSIICAEICIEKLSGVELINTEKRVKQDMHQNAIPPVPEFSTLLLLLVE